ncbi:hypothetical protein A6A04_07510 [Paramagnetospirillum marisnigri]|uniref:Phosphate ABC transporter substrate-binding protein n=2 Tax=Paramagnetospirillum marisnigri TaxID=1285242 RepID=A0A178M7C4_9PROT|nr:hypothetical protein A6A04_07510 [Paramagnetospirillum marisnigri]
MISALIPLLFIHAASATASDTPPLRVILLPYSNTVTLMKVHQPLRLHLQDKLQRPVELFTSADFPGHFANIRQGEFDLAVTGPHFGAWAVEHGHVALLRYRPSLSPVLAVRRGSGITGPNDLRGKVVVLSNRLSTSSLGGEHWLSGQGLIAGKDYTLKVSPTHTSAIMAVTMGEADAAITTHTPIQQSPEDIRSKIAEIVSPISLPHLFTVANSRLAAGEVSAIREALLSFEASDAGKAFFTETGYLGYTPLSVTDMDAMRPYVDMFLRNLDQ